MELYNINGGNFTCDAGALFGAVPKVLWSRQINTDPNNQIKLTMRCLLVVHNNRKVLIETGAGTKLPPKYAKNNGVENSEYLVESIKEAGFLAEEITDVVYTHLHWDHSGGGTYITNNGEIVPTFPNACHYVSRKQWENAQHANPREADAYFESDFLPLEKAGLLNFIDEEMELFPGFEIRIFNGHTPGLIIPIINTGKRKLVYTSDLIPISANIPIKWIAAYDLYPVTTMNEKMSFLREVYNNNYILFFEHDFNNECATIKWDERKGPLLDKTGKLSDFLD